MDRNPLFPITQDDTPQPPAAVAGADAAAALIRDKVARLYTEEPNAQKALAEAEQPPRSKHQQFMHELSTSGKDLAQIQTEWHNYYVALPDDEKHLVWQEFYEKNSQTGQYNQHIQRQVAVPQPAVEPVAATDDPVGVVVAEHTPIATPKHSQPDEPRSLQTIKTQLIERVKSRGAIQPKSALRSLGFGLSCGLVVLIIFLFGFFNEVVITPFIQPGRTVSATPIIVDPGSIAADGTSKVIIPKINVEIPLDFSQTTTDEAKIEEGLDNGVVHYPTTAQPGQQGNAAFFGHSSNNIFNKGKYKFAFVLLKRMENGDTFYITKDGKVYAYKVISKRVVPPTEVSVLDPVEGQIATATLITCDPPGTSLNRLIVVGQQISPDPGANVAAAQPAAAPAEAKDEELPGNGPTLFGRIWQSIF